MSQVVLGKSENRNVGISIDNLLATRLLIQANSGGGKSWLLRRLANHDKSVAANKETLFL